ncbi:uncharacterized protein N7473_006263 [Penicillium subrubescens]|uniref:Farnesyl pyrophosphate synthase n=1 Tax=Penicillium subrubescens TaxID=1316194 RepID=A0A1Q5UEL0_9EURO|nr:uncharacterized protein N7473_006263 [Penicillium subrubescens]KAJ5896864.1 hypothetical protein N7473_006263 [Penicillium subrubescens]OKP10906.1 Farnesyl pyrophosphate synthase [Penicillium subrubescens]
MTVSTGERVQSVLAEVIREVTEHVTFIGLGPEAVERIFQCLTFNTKGGNLLRSRTALDSGRILNGHELSPAQSEDLAVLGCLLELLNAAYVVWDDIMDGSTTRRGQPCWYRREKVGMMAINDACLLRSAINVTLKKRFRKHPSYLELHDMFDEACLRTELGQHCDLMATAKLLELDKFSWNQYEFITAQKTAFYTIYLPMAIPLVYLGLATAEKLDKVYKTSMLLGHVFQARDDFLHVYGDPLVTGKVGTDIQENKCSWLSVWTLENCNDEQRKVFQRCYGSTNEDDVLKVKELFHDLNVSKAFLDWDKDMWTKIEAAVEELKDPALKELHTTLLSKYNRDPRRSVAPSA